MKDKQYDPDFSSGDRTHTIMDTYRDHHARQANCYCSICWCAKQVMKLSGPKDGDPLYPTDNPMKRDR